MEQVGYDTYCTLLDEVVKELNGEKVEEELDVQIDIDVSSYIPETYIKDANQKIEVYQNIALCKNEKDIEAIKEEVIDRFGLVPKELENLLNIARIKYLAKSKNIVKIQTKKGGKRVPTISFIFESEKLDININGIIKKYGNKMTFTNNVKPTIVIELQKNSQEEIIQTALETLDVMLT